MSWLRRFRGLVELLLRRRHIEKELDNEVESYFEMLVDRQIERGVPAEEARRLTRANAEGPEQVKEKIRDARAGAWIVSMRRDVKYALRTIRKNRAFAAVTILTLALGIGATTAIFSVVYAVLLHPLPYRAANRLVLLFQTSAGDSREPLLLPDFETLRAHSQSFSGMAVYYKNTGFSRVTLSGVAEPESVQGGYVSSNFFPLLGISPSIGRVFTAIEEARGAQVIVLSHAIWQRRFGSIPGIVGRTLEIDGQPLEVIGVMPADFQFPARDTQLWAPISTNRYWPDRPTRGTNARGFYARWSAVARLKPEVSIEQAQAEMDVLSAGLDERDRELNAGLGLRISPLQVEVSGNTRLALSILMVAVSFLLLIACVNAAHLMLARGATRHQEIAVRISLGARRGDVLRQLVTESVLLSLFAGLCGVALASAGLRILAASAPVDVPRLDQASLNREVLAFALAVSFLAAILSGLLPAWTLSGTAPHDALKTGFRTSSGTPGLSRIRAVLVMAEFALTVFLLTGAGLSIRSFLAVQAVDPGFDPGHVLTVRVTLPVGSRQTHFYDQALERIASLRGVRAAGAVSGVFEQSTSEPRVIQGNELPRIVAGRPRVRANWKVIRCDYFQAMGIPLVRGRFFGSQDRAATPLVAIIDENMARRYWPGESAVGKQFRGQDARGQHDDPLTVVGVVGDSRSRGREAELAPHVFQPISQLARQDNPATPDLVIRTAGDPAKLAASVRDIVRSLDRAAIISTIATMEQQLDRQASPRRYQTWILSVFSLLAMLLASVGIYGVMHYTVAQRTNEIGIRMALGAEPTGLFRMILKDGLVMMAPGIAAGLLAARWLAALLGSILFGVKPEDPITYSAVGILLTTVAAAAVSGPAWRAATIDPVKALHRE